MGPFWPPTQTTGHDNFDGFGAFGGYGGFGHDGLRPLEDQQRYFSYRVTLVAIVSQNYLVFILVGVSHNCRAICCKTGYCTDVPGVSHHFGELLTSMKNYLAIWGIAATISQYRAIWGH